MSTPVEYVETLAQIRELFPQVSDEHAFEIADRAHGRTVLDPERLDAAITALRKRHSGMRYDEAHAAVSAAIVAYMRHDQAGAEA